MKTYKGFDKDLKCKGFQYEIGKEYEMDGEIKACQRGFHACEAPLDVFIYYAPGLSRFCEVEQSGELSREEGKDTKVASSKIKIGAEIGVPGFVKAQIEWTKEKAAKTTKSDTANAATSGARANAATSGDGAVAVCSGTDSSAEANGIGGLAVACGKDCKARGKLGNFLVLCERADWNGKEYPLLNAKMIRVDGETYKADTWYSLKDGKIAEVNP